MVALPPTLNFEVIVPNLISPGDWRLFLLGDGVVVSNNNDLLGETITRGDLLLQQIET
jgi:hypothetical protein